MTTGMGDPVAMASLAVGVLVLAGLLALGWRRSRALGAGGGRIELVTSRYLGGKRVLTLVDVEGERLLLALSGNTVRLVARIGARPRPWPQADSGLRPGSIPERSRPESRASGRARSETRYPKEGHGDTVDIGAVPAREEART